jgi:uncharacterized SAM-binding protein YcdF (DUF218 family)
MTSACGPDFEPSFGSRATDKPLDPQLRDRREVSEHVERGLGADAVQDQSDMDGGAGGSISEPVESVESHRTAADDTKPFSRPGKVAGEPMLAPSAAKGSSPGRDADRNRVVPAEILEAQDRSAEGRGDPTPSDGTGHPRRVGTRWFRIRRRIVAICGAAIALGLLYFLVSLLQVWSTGRTDDAGPVHAIVVMGAAQYDGRPSPQLAARLDHVVEIWPSGVAPLVVVTGGNIPGDRFTEAEASAEYLTERGIPADVILLENTGSTSQESLTSVSEMLAAQGLEDVMIVTDPYHALRSRLIAEEVGLDAQVSSTDTSVVTGFDSFKRHVREAGGVAVGRIIGFERLSELVD